MKKEIAGLRVDSVDFDELKSFGFNDEVVYRIADIIEELDYGYEGDLYLQAVVRVCLNRKVTIAEEIDELEAASVFDMAAS